MGKQGQIRGEGVNLVAVGYVLAAVVVIGWMISEFAQVGQIERDPRYAFDAPTALPSSSPAPFYVMATATRLEVALAIPRSTAPAADGSTVALDVSGQLTGADSVVLPAATFVPTLTPTNTVTPSPTPVPYVMVTAMPVNIRECDVVDQQRCPAFAGLLPAPDRDRAVVVGRSTRGWYVVRVAGSERYGFIHPDVVTLVGNAAGVPVMPAHVPDPRIQPVQILTYEQWCEQFACEYDRANNVIIVQESE